MKNVQKEKFWQFLCKQKTMSLNFRFFPFSKFSNHLRFIQDCFEPSHKTIYNTDYCRPKYFLPTE